MLGRVLAAGEAVNSDRVAGRDWNASRHRERVSNTILNDCMGSCEVVKCVTFGSSRVAGAGSIK